MQIDVNSILSDPTAITGVALILALLVVALVVVVHFFLSAARTLKARHKNPETGAVTELKVSTKAEG